jgi:uncharacterized protein YndB with AHSA1/START domain
VPVEEGSPMGVQIGLLNVRRSILIEASPAEVWREFESFERIAAWLGRGHVLHGIEPKLGGQVDLSVEIDGERRHYGGRVLVWEPERELTFENNWAAPHAWPVPTLWTIRLTPLYDGTQVELFHHWDVKHLKALRAIVEH